MKIRQKYLSVFWIGQLLLKFEAHQLQKRNRCAKLEISIVPATGSSDVTRTRKHKHCHSAALSSSLPRTLASR